MKINKHILALFLLLLCTNSYGMKREHSITSSTQFTNARVKVAFAPQLRDDINNIENELFSFLDNAKKQVLVAMYWITDDTIIDQLISLKKRQIDIQIIIDETSRGRGKENIIKKLLKANIIPLIYPSLLIEPRRIMHNKFLVVDSKRVFTGSANFTKNAFDPETISNYENVVILKSEEIGQKYKSNFFAIKNTILNYYVDIVAANNRLPEWTDLLFPKYYHQLRPIAQDKLSSFNQIEQERLQQSFNLQPIQQVKPPTAKQKKVLRKHGYTTAAIERISRDEASKLIGRILNQPKPSTSKKRKARGKQISQWQKDFLRDHDYETEEIEDMSSDEAYELVGDIKRQEKKEQEKWYW